MAEPKNQEINEILIDDFDDSLSGLGLDVNSTIFDMSQALLTLPNGNSLFTYELCAPISAATKLEDETLTYLNQSQPYELRLQRSGEDLKILESQIILTFHDKRFQHHEKELIESWQNHHPGERLLDLETSLSFGFFDVTFPSVNSIKFLWKDVEASIFFIIQCTSSEFSPRKQGGEKGVPFRIQVETYQDGRIIHAACCQVKTFKSKGADRKQRTDREKIEKKFRNERIAFRPETSTTILMDLELKSTKELNYSNDMEYRLIKQNRKINQLTKLHESSTTNQVCQWLKENRFEQFINTFRDFSGIDILRLSREDFIQICGLIDGIRLENALHSKKVKAKLSLYLCQESPSMASRRRKKSREEILSSSPKPTHCKRTMKEVSSDEDESYYDKHKKKWIEMLEKKVFHGILLYDFSLSSLMKNISPLYGLDCDKMSDAFLVTKEDYCVLLTDQLIEGINESHFATAVEQTEHSVENKNLFGIKSTMSNGHLLTEAPVAVDFWTNKNNCLQGRLLFLSHCHSDHTKGLNKKWNQVFYASEISAAIAKNVLGVNEKYIRILSVNVKHKLETSTGKVVNVRLIDAEHCPGAVMFLFEGDFGSILYTGDFRFERCFKSISCLPKEVDVLYLDNTYCSEKYRTFPSRIDALEKIIELCLVKNKIRIITPKIGKENILITVAAANNTKVVVDHSHMNIIQQLEDVDISMFTTDRDGGKIIALPYKLKNKACDETEHFTLLPSGQAEPKVREHCAIIPYSDHSSLEELEAFVKLVKPTIIKPIVKLDNTDFSIFKKYMRSKQKIVYDFHDIGDNDNNDEDNDYVEKEKCNYNKRNIMETDKGVEEEENEDENADEKCEGGGEEEEDDDDETDDDKIIEEEHEKDDENMTEENMVNFNQNCCLFKFKDDNDRKRFVQEYVDKLLNS
ncbi:DgyrCDS2059 [Dimorphilus gyrociliatus]|uniref:DgyrCDS2059 n=1 Tax=Dimorphilus gyrociliatus TaxID=2664684 RepID=A0A7I8V9C1_9ANNE|nr:DgyrCDS2059 [Dimorphilus gyrociliatus]